MEHLTDLGVGLLALAGAAVLLLAAIRRSASSGDEDGPADMGLD